MIKKYLTAYALLSLFAIGFTQIAKADAISDSTRLTAAVIKGKWTGSMQSLNTVESPMFSSSVGSPSDSINVTIPNGTSCSGGPPCDISTTTATYSLNISDTARLVAADSFSDIVFTLSSSGSSVKGTVTSATDATTLGTLYGTIVSGQFLLLHLVLNDSSPGDCLAGHYQITGAMVPSGANKLLIFSGSGVGSDCKHEIFSGSFHKL
jgi:hypothetical protein